MKQQSYIDINKVKAELKKLNIDKKYLPIDVDAIFKHDYSIFVSTRETAKTTNTLIIGLVLYKLYGTVTEYLRCDENQTRRAVIEPLYDVIRNCHYVERLFPHQYNDIEYNQTKKAFTLIHRDDEGNIDNRDTEKFCRVHSNEKWQTLKSGYNSPKGDFIVFDEFFDSQRATQNQISELWNNISTIGRVFDEKRRVNVHCVMLGNNTDPNSFWWDEFCVAEKIRNLKNFGETFSITSELGTTVYFKSVDLTVERKDTIRRKNIPFFGFNTPRAAQFTGTALWSSKDYLHLPDLDMIKPEYKITDKLYIHHRDRWVQLDMYYNEDNGYYVFLHWAKEPRAEKTCLVLTLEPKLKREVYGLGRFSFSDKAFNVIKKYYCLREENRWYYLNNQIGAIIDDYMKNAK